MMALPNYDATSRAMSPTDKLDVVDKWIKTLGKIQDPYLFSDDSVAKFLGLTKYDDIDNDELVARLETLNSLQRVNIVQKT